MIIKRGNYKANIRWDDEWSEYIVTFSKNGKSLGKDHSYHTDDRNDAIGTANAELNIFNQLTS